MRDVIRILIAKHAIEGLRERTEYIDIFLLSAHHSIMFCLLVEGEVYGQLADKPTRRN